MPGVFTLTIRGSASGGSWTVLDGECVDLEAGAHNFVEFTVSLESGDHVLEYFG
jgi:hypothetical protein